MLPTDSMCWRPACSSNRVNLACHVCGNDDTVTDFYVICSGVERGPADAKLYAGGPREGRQLRRLLCRRCGVLSGRAGIEGLHSLVCAIWILEHVLFFAGDRPFLLSGADDRLAKVWDYQTKACVQTLEGHAHNVSAVMFHPELPVILTGCAVTLLS